MTLDRTQPEQPAVIPSTHVHRVAAPVVVDGGNASHAHQDTITVIPLMDGDRIEAIEVRCQCGSSVIIECVYEEET